MGILSDHGIADVRHYSPLHYLPFIARSRSIMCKPSLAAAGFNPSHYRSMSRGQDVARGFGNYLHLTPDPKPPILKDKLKYGFPHVAIAVPVAAVDAAATSLCRFNVAMTRKLKRDGKPGYAESDRNGRYYAGHEIPIGRSPAEKRAMLTLNTKTMIEVLVHSDLLLPDDTKIIGYSGRDCAAAQNILARLGCRGMLRLLPLQVITPATQSTVSR